MVRAFNDLGIPLRRRPEEPAVPAPRPVLAPEPPFEPGPGFVRRSLRRLGRLIVRTVWLVVRWVATVGLVGAAAGVALVVGVRTIAHVASNSATVSPVRPITFEPLATRSVVYARDGSVLTTLHAEEDRVLVRLDEVPPHVVRAVLDAEDERFFEHGPLDVRSVVRAMVNNLEAGGVEEGGSTITQQLVKIELLNSKKDVGRKLKEAVLAVELEDQYTKHEILERYLNRVYFGNGAYGVRAAAQTYFGVDVGQLSLGQGILLAGLIRYPGGSDPFTNPDAARGRRDVVVDRMAFLGHISEEQANQVKAEPLPTPQPPKPAETTDYFAEHVKQVLLAAPWLGETYQERYQMIFEGGLAIHTTLDPGAQQMAQESVNRLLPEDPRGFTAALVSIEPATGAVRALVGGPNFDAAKFNLVTDGDGRQTGSAFKMFTLMAALEQGILPHDTISGAYPCPIPNPGSTDDPWTPTNVEGQGAGVMTLHQATVGSVNCAYARLIKLIGPQKVVDVARRLGVTNPLGAHLSLTLGSEPVTPLQMASAYATVAADGIRHEPHFVERVHGRDGTLLWSHADKAERAVSAQNARVVTEVLSSVVSGGTGTAAAIPGRQVAGKT
ncbi:MAG: transglycosylase domain-containing protein, partial [Actinomycetota bacterium]|nr:transglycosylase domain-containing protein [Actinomycetota bacterium]